MDESLRCNLCVLRIYQVAQQRLHLTAFGAGMRRLFGRKSDFMQFCLAKSAAGEPNRWAVVRQTKGNEKIL